MICRSTETSRVTHRECALHVRFTKEGAEFGPHVTRKGRNRPNRCHVHAYCKLIFIFHPHERSGSAGRILCSGQRIICMGSSTSLALRWLVVRGSWDQQVPLVAAPAPCVSRFSPSLEDVRQQPNSSGSRLLGTAIYHNVRCQTGTGTATVPMLYCLAEGLI